MIVVMRGEDNDDGEVAATGGYNNGISGGCNDEVGHDDGGSRTIPRWGSSSKM